MRLNDVLDAVKHRGERDHWLRPSEWAGSGHAYSLSSDDDVVTLHMPGLGAVEGMSWQVIAGTQHWEVVEAEAVRQEQQLTVEDDDDLAIPRQQLERVAAIMGLDSAAANALAEADHRAEDGLRSVFFRMGNDLVVGPPIA